MSAVEDFRDRLIAIQCVDGDVMEKAGFCPDTVKRMMIDPVKSFQRMTEGERVKFWPLVEEYLSTSRARAREWNRKVSAP